MSSSQIIDEITQYDSIYRSEGGAYAQFRKFLLKKNDKLNAKFRQNTYLSLRILLLETTRSRANHSLNDLWLLLHARRLKAPQIISISDSATEIIPWQQACTPFSATEPISTVRFAPSSHTHFAFSTLGGSLYFAYVEEGQMQIASQIFVPSVSFMRFEWLSENLIFGVGITSSAFLLDGNSQLFEQNLSNEVSEIARYTPAPGSVILGDRTGAVTVYNMSELDSTGESNFFQTQPASATLAVVDFPASKIYSCKKPISALAVEAENKAVLCGTSDGFIDILFVEQKIKTKKTQSITNLKVRSVKRIQMNKIIPGIKNTSIDSISVLFHNDSHFVFVNTRSENAAILSSTDGLKHIELFNKVRVPSLRARCPAALNAVGDKWIWLCGTDMGDLIMGENEDKPTILTLHESSIASLDWVSGFESFASGDVTGLVSFWVKQEENE